MILLDTDIAIDILRKHPPALAWIANIIQPVCLPGIVALELYQGCHNKRDAEALRRELTKFAVLWPSESVSLKILVEFPHAHLAYATGILDALIDATALSYNLPIYSFNQKHFAAFPQLQIVQPYVR